LLQQGRAAWGAAQAAHPLAARPPHFAPRAKRVIFLFMAGGPSQLELFDHKPKLRELDGQVVPPEYVKNKRFAFIKQDAKLLASRRKFARHGQSGAEISELLPHIASVADELAIVRSMVTEVFNHGPAKLFVNCGTPRFGAPSMGSWITYGIGSEAEDLPGFVVLQSGPRGPRGGAGLWSSGFLPTTFQGVPFLSGPEPILNLASPAGISPQQQADFVSTVRELNTQRLAAVGDAEIATRIAAYEMAYRMQSSAPALMDLSGETAQTLAAYGAEPGKVSYANNCLLARRLVERGVRFVQLYHTDWDHHGNNDTHLGQPLEDRCREVDQPTAALIRDLKQRGLLNETLVIWGGEFGRTPMGEPRDFLGRDHHIDGYTMFLAGGGIKAGITLGATDELGFYAVEDRVHVHDLQATILHLLGLDHLRLTFRFQGRDFRLTDVGGTVVHKLLA
ncbi:MAG: DUF1501 domain-containing protein, partial [Pirellulales bacterium]|nr:DUF1501 domain-containing protein [Pirellulales bacterium]